MSDVAIRVENLSKRYSIGETIRHDTMRDALVERLRRPFARFGGQPSTNGKEPSEQEFWALKDVSFEVKRGEVVGIIGRNGAGKSTLLKILSRITEPTSGKAEIHGRVGSLLEVGTGFHPELTGREGYLNGAILGMKRVEIDRKFDEIVYFSGVERFLDTPVKRYSSGMRVRLAFSVAAHLEPEILLIDEVLAVGDAQFQKKCLGKMGDVAGEGRTVIFVSHNMSAMQALCPRVIWLGAGLVVLDGTSDSVVNNYLESSIRKSSSGKLRSLPDDAVAYYAGALLFDVQGNECYSFPAGSSIILETKIRTRRRGLKVQCGIDICMPDGSLVMNVNSKILGTGAIDLQDKTILRWHIDEMRLVPGKYTVNLRLKDSEEKGFIDFAESMTSFAITSSDVYGNGYLISNNHGITYLPISLKIQ